MALRLAASNDQLEAVQYLVKMGANINAYGRYALRISASRDNANIVKFLIENGALMIDEEDLAIRRARNNGHDNIADFLLQNGTFTRLHVTFDDDVIIFLPITRFNR